MAFEGARVYVSRSLVPPQLIDRLHDTLKHNGAVVHRCCDPSARSPDDFHLLFSLDSEKSLELQAKGCQVIGPECVFQCAQHHKPLPKRSCTCCLALQGFRIHATGFDSQLQSRIELLVSQSCGLVDPSISSSTDVVIAASVSSLEYRLACSLSKPVVTYAWLEQCCREHRLLPHEPYTLPALSGLVICATQLLSEERTRVGEATQLNGGSYSPDLTRLCTHLIAKISDGKKYEVAKSWGTVKIVNQEWLWQSVAAKACLREELYALSSTSVMAPVADPPAHEQVVEAKRSVVEPVKPCDLYLADCRIHVVGFEEEDMKRVVSMVLDGGGTRYIEFNNTVSHVILGCHPTDSQRKYVRKVTSLGHTHVVSTIWLEDCAREKREVIVTSRHSVVQSLPGGTDALHQKPQRAQSLNVDATTQANETTKVSTDGEDKAVTISDNLPELEKRVFSGISFSFLDYFPAAQKNEVIEWITTGGGSVESVGSSASYSIGFHGAPRAARSNVVSVNWIRICLQGSKLVDPCDHVLYRPLTCRVPLPGFEKLKICISQYGETERVLCRQLCNVLGAAYTDILTKRVTHLFCKEGDGEKYQAAGRLGIRVVTIDWLYSCASQDAIVPLDNFRPRLPRPAAAAELSGRVPIGEFATVSQKNCSAKRKMATKKDPPAQKRVASDGACFDAWEELTASWSSADASLHLNLKAGSQPQTETRRSTQASGDPQADGDQQTPAGSPGSSEKQPEAVIDELNLAEDSHEWQAKTRVHPLENLIVDLIPGQMKEGAASPMKGVELDMMVGSGNSNMGITGGASTDMCVVHCSQVVDFVYLRQKQEEEKRLAAKKAEEAKREAEKARLMTKKVRAGASKTQKRPPKDFEPEEKPLSLLFDVAADNK